MGEAPGFFRTLEGLFAEAVRTWLERHGVYTGPRIYTDSLRMVQDRMEQLQPRGGGEDPLAERFPVGGDVVAPLEVTGGGEAPDLRAKLLRQLRGEKP